MERNTPPPSVSASVNRRGLFPESEAYASGWLATGRSIWFQTTRRNWLPATFC